MALPQWPNALMTSLDSHFFHSPLPAPSRSSASFASAPFCWPRLPTAPPTAQDPPCCSHNTAVTRRHPLRACNLSDRNLSIPSPPLITPVSTPAFRINLLILPPCAHLARFCPAPASPCVDPAHSRCYPGLGCRGPPCSVCTATPERVPPCDATRHRTTQDDARVLSGRAGGRARSGSSQPACTRAPSFPPCTGSPPWKASDAAEALDTALQTPGRCPQTLQRQRSGTGPRAGGGGTLEGRRVACKSPRSHHRGGCGSDRPVRVCSRGCACESRPTAPAASGAIGARQLLATLPRSDSTRAGPSKPHDADPAEVAQDELW